MQFKATTKGSGGAGLLRWDIAVEDLRLLVLIIVVLYHYSYYSVVIALSSLENEVVRVYGGNFWEFLRVRGRFFGCSCALGEVRAKRWKCLSLYLSLWVPPWLRSHPSPLSQTECFTPTLSPGGALGDFFKSRSRPNFVRKAQHVSFFGNGQHLPKHIQISIVSSCSGICWRKKYTRAHIF
jgi:hypothetical protein